MNKDTGVMNFSACWIVSSEDVFGVATDVPGLGIECHEFQVSLLRCIRHSVDGFEQVSSVDCSGIKGVNFQVSLLRCIRHSVDGFEQVSSVDCSGTKGVNFGCLLDCVIRYRNKCFWCCDRCSRSQYCHADIQEIITIVGTIFSQVLM
ncbi:uncharacterized protein [Dysidea avara]|uniref:uncharacterized protein isoform X2 n=1 Tax=Dysidea avara TaxID=196820 RepID=UPI00332F2AB1